MQISNGQALYSYDLNLNNFSLASTCPLSSGGLKYHIHSYWTNTSVTSSAGSVFCGSTYTGGHYDPNFGCSSSSQESSTSCSSLNRTSAKGYTYTCNTTIYYDGDYSEWYVIEHLLIILYLFFIKRNRFHSLRFLINPLNLNLVICFLT